jgi:hypothetical protein
MTTKTASTKKSGGGLPADYLKAYMSPAKKAKLRKLSKREGRPMYALVQEGLKMKFGL